MGKSSSQVVGYRYYAKFAMFIGNRIEKLIAVNFDNRGWHVRRPGEPEPNLAVSAPNLYGENEGGVVGVIDVFIGHPDQQPSEAYQQYLPLVSGYPYQSYLVFRSGANNGGFYLGNSGYMKEMLLWVKRTRVRNDGRGQWYEVRDDGVVVCEIGARKIFDKSELDLTGALITAKIDTHRFVDANLYQKTDETINNLDMGGLIQWDPQTKQFLPNQFFKSTGTRFSYGWSAGGISKISQTAKIKGNKGCYVRATVAIKQSGEKFDLNFSSGDTIFIIDRREFDGGDAAQTTVFDVVFRLDLGVTITSSVEGVYYQDLDIITESEITVSIEPVPRDFNIMVDNYDINPVHKIREILTDDTAMGKPETDVNDVNFMKAADQIYDEGLGISWAIDEKSCIEAIEELCYHIEAGIRVNRQTGLYEMILFRDDWFSDDEIHDISESKIKDLSLEVMNSDDIVNQLNVTYYDRERIKNSTFSIYENGSILTMGHANAESVEFQYFMNMRNAEIVANWKLKQFSTPAWSGSFTTGWREARKWNRYDLIRLPWSKKWNDTILVRIMKINLGNGTNNTVTIDFEEVIPYSSEMNTSIVVDAPVESAPQPPQPSMNAVFEAPYYLTVLRAGQTNTDLELSNNPDIGYVAAIAAKPQSNSLNALLYTDGVVDEFEQVSRLDYCDILQLDQPITETTSSFVVTGSLTQTANSSNLILLNNELMGFVGFDGETSVLTVKRGVLDTIPKKHSSGYLLVFDLPDVAFDSTQYAEGEVIGAQVLTTTPSGIQDLVATGTTIEIQSRAIRPYPPANVKINGEYWPDEAEGDLEITWAHRNRLQQTANTHVGWFESSVTKESGVLYNAKIYDAQTDALFDRELNIDSDTVTFASTGAPALAKLVLESHRDGYLCLHPYQHVFAWGKAPESFITAFTSSGAFVVPDGVTSVDVLIVAGGGGGGSRQGGGGGAGGLIARNIAVASFETINVVVGLGGAGGINGGQGADGQNSSFGSIVATGGGGGGGRTVGAAGRVGGSGGGGADNAVGGSGAVNQGEAGGYGLSNVGGGGGGAGGLGNNASGINESGIGGNGGAGRYFEALSEYGQNGYFAGGGGGGSALFASAIGGVGGIGGGGSAPNLTDIATPGGDGLSNTGGGGGASNVDAQKGGDGGSGIVIIATAGTFI